MEINETVQQFLNAVLESGEDELSVEAKAKLRIIKQYIGGESTVQAVCPDGDAESGKVASGVTFERILWQFLTIVSLVAFVVVQAFMFPQVDKLWFVIMTMAFTSFGLLTLAGYCATQAKQKNWLHGIANLKGSELAEIRTKLIEKYFDSLAENPDSTSGVGEFAGSLSPKVNRIMEKAVGKILKRRM